MKTVRENNYGLSLIEVMIAIAIFAVFAAGIATTIISSLTATKQGEFETRAVAYLQEGIEAVRAIRDNGFNRFQHDQSGVQDLSSFWEFKGEGTTDNLEIFNRILTFDDVYRNSNYQIVDQSDPGARFDVHTKKITATVSWLSYFGFVRQISNIVYLTNWDRWHFFQTNWNGGDGQTYFVDETRFNSDNGSIDSSIPGQLSLQGADSTSFSRWIPGGGAYAIYDTDVQFDLGSYLNSEVVGAGTAAKVSLNQELMWASYVSTEESVAFDSMLLGLHMYDSNLGYAVGNKGTILKWNGTGWSSIKSNTSQQLNDVWVVSANNVWVVGKGGLILHWNGFSWTTVISGTSKMLEDVYFIDENNGWIVARGGEILKWNGAVWTNFTSPTSKDLNSLTFLSSTEGWAVGDSGVILSWNGVSWNQVASPVNEALYSINCLSSNYCVAVGAQGTILNYDGVSWTAIVTDASRELHGVMLTSLSAGQTVGGNGIGNGEILEWDGTEWNLTASGTVNGMHDVWMLSENNGFAVGGAPNVSTILQYNGNEWIDITGGTTADDVYDLEMIGVNDGWAVAESGTIYKYSGIDWIVQNSPVNDHLYAVEYFDNTNSWAVGNQGTIVYYDGTNWSEQVSSTANALYGVSFVSAADGWAVGTGGIITHWNGTSWSNVASSTINSLNDVYMIGSSQGWAVGNAGTILQWNGTDWSSVSSPTTNNLNNIFFLSPSNGWAVGDGGIILKWDGANWSVESSSTTTNLNAVDFFDVNNGWAVGDNGVIVSWNGLAWTVLTGSPTSRDLNAVGMALTTNVWAGGQLSSFIHYYTQYELDGVYTSGIIDSGDSNTNWDYISWIEENVNGSIDIEINTRTGNTAVPDGTWSSFQGSYTNPNGEILTSPNNRYLQFEVVFSSNDPNVSPLLDKVSINYNNPTTENLYAIDLISENIGFATGNNGALNKYNGISWIVEASPTTNNLFGIDFVNSNQGWAVGQGGIILSQTAGVWSQQSSPTVNDLYDVAMISDADGWAVGAGGEILQWDGSTWLSFSSPTVNNLYGIDMLNSSTGWAVGAGGIILRWDGTSWVTVSSPIGTQLNDVNMVSSSHGWAVGNGGVILEWNGSTWSQSYSQATNNLNAVFLVTDNDGWIVGDNGVIMRYLGIGWSVTTSPVTTNLNDVSLVDTNVGWIIGDNGLYMKLERLSGFGSYQSLGYLVSSAFDTGAASNFLTIEWQSDDSCAASSSDSFDWNFSSSAEYSYDVSKIEVTSDVAQLILDGSCNGTANTCDTFASQAPCESQLSCNWGGGSCSGTPSSCSTLGVDCLTCGCTQSVGTCVNNGSCASCGTTGICTSCNNCFWAGKKCKGTLNCSVYTDSTACFGCTQCTWVAGSCGGTPSVCSAHATETSCNTCGCAWTSATCTGTANTCDTFGSQVSCQNQSGCAWTGLYPNDNPSIQPNSSLQVSDLSSWQSFSETATKNGGEIYYQLSDDDGATWYYWSGAAWTIAGSNNFNNAIVINSNIDTFDTSSGKIMFKAFLDSDGVSQVVLDNVNISYVTALGGSGGDCGVRFQIKTAPDNGGVPGAWSSTWCGPDGDDADEDDFYERASLIHPDHNGDRWIMYKVYLFSDGASSPILYESTISYKNQTP